MSKDYYNILSIEKNANDDQIKKAYKKLAAQNHPDRAPPDKKEEYETKFKQIGEAFDVLGNREKKEIYDNDRFNK